MVFDNIAVPLGRRLAHIALIDVRHLTYRTELLQLLDTYQTPDGPDITPDHTSGWMVWLGVGKRPTNNPITWLGTYILLLANGAAMRVTHHEDWNDVLIIKGPTK